VKVRYKIKNQKKKPHPARKEKVGGGRLHLQTRSWRWVLKRFGRFNYNDKSARPAYIGGPEPKKLGKKGLLKGNPGQALSDQSKFPPVEGRQISLRTADAAGGSERKSLGG